ncbi:urease subunit beta [Serratia entomophila]|uniref:urease subunit beta n=1 Tax=Serratia entomophila TaxID=42906 RepID=UPI00217B5B77|nr:urease subunit beta [Serratia entomophila]CAI1161479.1 Urease subunit beta 1 [Serratia entomophila]CAI2522526.1 Urease subunit beta 1 [Serratia entomophila]
MIPGEIITLDGHIELNADRPSLNIEVTNAGDRPISVASHYHFFYANPQLIFNRAPTYDHRLDIPAGMMTRWEPGQTSTVTLILRDRQKPKPSVGRTRNRSACSDFGSDH